MRMHRKRKGLFLYFGGKEVQDATGTKLLDISKFYEFSGDPIENSN